MAALTPMMQQYMAIKEQYKDCILFYRLGDFYEMFYDDALTASRELEITLTGKNCGQEERAPMCGVPYHAVDVYLNKLVAKGYKVAICEQAEDPKQAKGIVKREVIRIVTPGTNLSQQALDEGRNNYLMCLVYDNNQFGLAITDISTGDFYTTEVATLKELYDEIHRFSPSEIICNDSFYMSGASLDDFKDRLHVSVSTLDTWYMDEAVSVQKIKEHFKVASLDGLGLTDFPSGTLAVGALLLYLYETQKNTLDNLTKITPYRSGGYMIIDSATNRNLELIETLREKQKKGSLLWVLDKTKTAMGARLMRNWIEQPLIEKKKITARQDAVEELYNDMITREEIREYLNAVYDLERLVTRISYRTANPRDLIAFKTSLGMIPPVKQLLSQAKSAELKEIDERMDCLEDIYDLIEKSIQDEPPIMIREGGMIKEGYNEDVDKFRLSRTEGKTWLAELEAREKEKTGIKNLRVRYNKVFGYYLEVTNSYKELVPEDWTRKQTLANAERYITPELKELEDMILGAEDKLAALEYDLYCEVRDSIGEQVVRIQETAKAIAHLDVLASLACVAQSNDYVRPSINTKGVIDIQGGRHPVVEKMNNNQMFIDNDTYLDNKNHRISIITGPNMAGKSTYMRQSALIVLMAQIGSFVPAKSANIGIVDRIFTRVGASDDLASGQSTFMVEMTEVANILRNATSRSLLILDEIGRGTSTFDGLSIAWAVVEHISNPKLLGAKTLFATHYHELTELEGKLDSVNNYCIAVREQGDDIIFLRKIIRGGADKSYGIQVARLAGVPDSVIDRAKEIASWLEETDVTDKAKNLQVRTSAKKKEVVREAVPAEKQMSLFDIYPADHPVLKELAGLDVSNMTPIQALNTLYELQKRLKETN
ncbi:DNA mismatch repair protein MutS [Coprococcus catus]|uniref:DNA mismatch repair protein MutS n=1 Tax=Coprococcus catus TaxID=116085 RepID=UPI0015BFF59F|nr:DNA mismatch repair protein MutS [Coprococcus catus]MBT9771668.1 DNA mismatch repair protein MutS [Coprococcus catus]MBX9230042.1 DNA mismatch repair protein MutS [Coprococcus catus]MCT6798897.1 DNA mismatch repair protein MutS [Coprococcus catus]